MVSKDDQHFLIREKRSSSKAKSHIANTSVRHLQRCFRLDAADAQPQSLATASDVKCFQMLVERNRAAAHADESRAERRRSHAK